MRDITSANIQFELNNAKMRWDDEEIALPATRNKAHKNSLQNIELQAHDNITSIKQAWLKLEKQADISIYQRYEWLETYINTIVSKLKFTTLIVTGHRQGEMVFALPMAINNGIIPKVGWIGGNHSNFNMMLINRKFAATLGDDDIVCLFDNIKKLLPGHGYLKLCCQPESWGQKANPLLALPTQRSTNGAYGIELNDGFAGVLAAGNGKRKRKKFRMQTRAAEKFGGAQLVEAKTLVQVNQILECFFDQKTERLISQGINDVFGSDDARQFLRHLAASSIECNEPLLKLYALKIDGKFRAIYGGGVHGKHFSAYFTSFANDALAHISPGEMLTYMLVEKLANDGFQFADLGCGEERFKHSWCSQYIGMFDVIIPLSPLSSGHAFVERAALTIKRKIRETPKLWNLYKRARVVVVKITDRV